MFRARPFLGCFGTLVSLGMMLVLLASLREVHSATFPRLAETRPLLGMSPERNISAVSPSGVMTNGWTNLYPNLFAVTAKSSTEAWASGEYGHLMHYVEGSWTSIDPSLMQGVDLLDISMASYDAIWIAAGNKAYQYDGTVWNERSAGLGSELFLERVSALGLNDVWGITRGPSCGHVSQIVHWDGNQWNPVLASNTRYALSDIEMIGTNDGWAVGRSCSPFRPIVLHYDGSSWTEVQGPSDPTLVSFFELSVTGSNDFWTCGNPYNNTNRAIYHYDHGAWTSWLLPYTTEPGRIYMINDNEGWFITNQSIWHWDGQVWAAEYSGHYFKAISGAGGQVWAVGLSALIMSRSGGGAWAQQQGAPTEQQLNHVSALSANDAWAVGNAGTIVHFSGGDWHVVTSTIGADLHGVHMLSPIDGYAVGGLLNSSGVIARWDGVSWQQVITTATTLNSIFMVDSSEGWAVGNGGAIWHSAGNVWTQATSPTTYTLSAVAMDSASHGWAVGSLRISERYRSVLLEYDGTVWVDRTDSFLPYQYDMVLNDITLAPGGAEGWAVGSDALYGGVILRLSGGVWTSSYLPPPMNSVAPDEGGTAWAFGLIGTPPMTYHYTGETWQPTQLPMSSASPSDIYGAAIVPGEVGWAVGSYGMVMSYSGAGSPPSPTATYSVSTSTPTATATPSNMPTETQTPNSTPSSTPSITSTATNTSTNIPANTNTPTATSWATNTLTVTSTSINTPTNTSTSTNTPTHPPSSTATRTDTPTGTSVITNTPNIPTGTSTSIATDTATNTPIATPTVCVMNFVDVVPGAWFYGYVEYFYCHGVLGGYSTNPPCTTGTSCFKPENTTTRGQLAKIVTLAFAFPVNTTGGPHFQDVPNGHTFYSYVETAFNLGLLGGYPCGASGEPCLAPGNLPYYRPSVNVTRGQIAKIIVNAAILADPAHWTLLNPGTNTFHDVDVGSTFFQYVETALAHNLINGYRCGISPAGPCGPGNKPYVLPGADATRAQVSKVVYLAVTDPPRKSK